eukprot:CAMPEP_0176429500 /NCGR_PEP_ID=MMETSP0127-20121128/13745_1 /TAXON_ID=938130 /ORGANISM="Platyophrya macrostoma, Strain WH" /LENGTH=207 /DNA_ID=CAMNT_0017811311 /DNA_START=96 /DNA_END=716 /DNA_ORIENTATION=+
MTATTKDQQKISDAAAPHRLKPLDRVLPIYQTTYFWGTFLLTLLITFGANYYVDKNKLEGILQRPLSDAEGVKLKLTSSVSSTNEAALHDGYPMTFCGEVFAFVVITSFLVFIGAGNVRKRIIDGKAAAVTTRALGCCWWQRAFFFSQRIPSGKRRLLMLAVQTLLFSGLPAMTIIVGAVSQFECLNTLSAQTFLLTTASWKTAIAA